MTEAFTLSRRPTPFGWIWKCKSSAGNAEATVSRASLDALGPDRSQFPADAVVWVIFNFSAPARGFEVAAELLRRILAEADRVGAWVAIDADREGKALGHASAHPLYQRFGFVPPRGGATAVLHRPPGSRTA
jgi:hypothetical protein